MRTKLHKQYAGYIGTFFFSHARSKLSIDFLWQLRITCLYRFNIRHAYDTSDVLYKRIFYIILIRHVTTVRIRPHS